MDSTVGINECFYTNIEELNLLICSQMYNFSNRFSLSAVDTGSMANIFDIVSSLQCCKELMTCFGSSSFSSLSKSSVPKSKPNNEISKRYT